ncbi:MAG TPA: hypothetical protein VFN21_13865 [Acidimicrobiales bacterium]|nr:hypothetical protein [Acidimicrobiales bacterium]
MSAEAPGWTRSVWVHSFVLLGLLVALVPIIGLRGQTLNDEGAAMAQVQLLNQHHTWFMPNPFPEADPDGSAFPLDRSTQGEHGFAPLIKHPAYPVLLAGADRLGGRFGIVVLGILGTVMAAVSAALIAREIRPELALPTFWITGLFSPLFFDAFIVVAHSIAAAGAGIAALGLVRWLRHRSRSGLVMSFAGIAWVTALRNEGLLLGIALGGAVVAQALLVRRKDLGPRRPTWWLGPAVVGAAALAFALDRFAGRLLTPTTLPSTLSATSTTGGYLADRVDAFILTWLLPGYASSPDPIVGPILVVVFTALLALQLRKTRPDRGLCIVAIVGMWAGALYWVVFTSVGIVPGILMAFPLLAVAIVAWKRPRVTDTPVVVLAIAVSLFALGVLATTYRVGGTTEWGSRYLAIGIPLATPLIALTLERSYRRLPDPRRVLAVLAAVPLAIAPAVVSVTSLRAAHKFSAVRIADEVADHVHDTTPGDGGKPVVVTDMLYLPRIAWRDLDQARWLAADDERLSELVVRLHGLGIEEFLFITDETRPRVGGGYDLVDCVRQSRQSSPWSICRAIRAPVDHP